jgi:hypothetical protein
MRIGRWLKTTRRGTNVSEQWLKNIEHLTSSIGALSFGLSFGLATENNRSARAILQKKFKVQCGLCHAILAYQSLPGFFFGDLREFCKISWPSMRSVLRGLKLPYRLVVNSESLSQCPSPSELSIFKFHFRPSFSLPG